MSGSFHSGYFTRLGHFTPNARKFLAYTFFIALSQGVYSVLFNLYILRLGYHEDLLGLMLSITFITVGLVAVPVSVVSDRIGRRNALLLSSIIQGIGLAVLYTAASKDLLLLMSVVYGIGQAFNIVSGSPFLTENSDKEERMHLFSFNQVVLMTGSIAGNLAGGALPGILSQNFGFDIVGPASYRFALYLSLLAIIMTLVPILLIKEKKKESLSLGKRLQILGSVIQSTTAKKLALVNGLIGIGAGLIVPFFNVYFYKVLNASTDQIGIIFGIAQVTMIVGLLVVPAMTFRFGKVRTIAITEIASIPFLLLIAFTFNVWIAGFAYIMRMTLMNMANPAISSFNMEMVDESRRANINSITSMSWYLCLALSTYISGLMMAASNYLLPYLITCIVYLLAALLYYVFFIKVERGA